MSGSRGAYSNRPADARARRAEYGRLRDEGLEPSAAANEVIPLADLETALRYERWYQAAKGQVEPSADERDLRRRRYVRSALG